MTQLAYSAEEIQRLINPTIHPTPEQIKVIESPLHPLLVVAGAGSGKTETMAMRVLWAVANEPNITASRVLGLTFTKKAAGELKDRLRSRLKKLSIGIGVSEQEKASNDDDSSAKTKMIDPHEEPTSMTYNAFAGQIVSEHGLRIGLNPDVIMLSQAGSVQLMTDIMTNWPKRLDENITISSAVTKALSLNGQLGEHGLSIEQAREQLGQFGAELTEVGDSNDEARKVQERNQLRIALLDPIAQFQRRKRELGVMDFSDQLTLATRIVKTVPDVVEQIRKEYGLVLLDEFQDTSVIQMELLSTLFKDQAVTAVGDPNQAIYGWRGASASSLESFMERFCSEKPKPEQTLTLSTAWRNDRQILVCANEVAKPLRSHSHAATSPVLVESTVATEGDVEIAYEADRDAQIAHVVDYVQRLRDTHPHGWEIGILCRKKSHFLPIDRALREHGIPTQVLGLGGLLEQPVVADLRAALEITNSVDASPALLRLLVREDIGASDLRLLGQWASRLNRKSRGTPYEGVLLSAVDSPPEVGWTYTNRQAGLSQSDSVAKSVNDAPQESDAQTEALDGPSFSELGYRRVLRLGERLRKLRSLRGHGLVELAERASQIMGILDDAIADPLGSGARESLDAFIDQIAGYESSVDNPTLAGLVEWLNVAESDPAGLKGVDVQPDPSAVQILTVHGSKGLEWDSVIVFGMSDTIFPSHRSKSVYWRDKPPAQTGWVMAPEELPHPLRGDYGDLPPFNIDVSNGRTPSAGFSNWLKTAYGPELGAYLEREERRLAYVAMTRARHTQLLIGSWLDESKTLRNPSRYLMASRHAMIEDFEQILATGQVVWANGNVDVKDGNELQELQKRIDGLNDVIVEAPTPESLAQGSEEETIHFPFEIGPSRQAVAKGAQRVRQAQAELKTDADVFELLDALGESQRVKDVTALIEEHRLASSKETMVIRQDHIPATSVSKMLEDIDAFALDMRRPMPAQPSDSATLGTIFHAWVERQLHLASAEERDEPVAGIETLDEHERARLRHMQDNFVELPIVQTGTPIAIEEAFSVKVADISVNGRIDAVFEDKHGKTIIVDWKTGQAPHKNTKKETLRYYATQLRLYRLAWSQLTGLAEESITPMLAFVDTNTTVSLDDLVKLGGAGLEKSLEDEVKRTLKRA